MDYLTARREKMRDVFEEIKKRCLFKKIEAVIKGSDNADCSSDDESDNLSRRDTVEDNLEALFSFDPWDTDVRQEEVGALGKDSGISAEQG